MKLKWHNTDQSKYAPLEDIVMEDLKRLDIDSPINLVFHHVFLSNDYRGPCVFVWGDKDSDYFNCEYVENPQWSTGKET